MPIHVLIVRSEHSLKNVSVILLLRFYIFTALVATDKIAVVNGNLSAIDLTSYVKTSDLPKILNVVENGSLTRNGSAISGFSSSNYLQPADRINNNIINFSDGIKNISSLISAANSWEMKVKVNINVTNGATEQVVWCDDTSFINYFTVIFNGNTNKIIINLTVGNNGWADIAENINTIDYNLTETNYDV